MSQGPPDISLGNVGDFCFQNAPPGPNNVPQPILIPGPKGDASNVPGKQGIQGPPGSPGLYTTFTPPTLSAFTLTNAQSGATLTQAGNSIVLYGPNNNSDNWSMALKAIPATPYSCIFNLAIGMVESNTLAHTAGGVCWRDSATGKVKSIGRTYSSASSGQIIEVGAGTDGTAHITVDYVVNLGGMETYTWFRLRDDGVNQTYSISADGATWLQVYTQARNTDVTPNQVGFFTNPRNGQGFDMYSALWSYQETG